MLLLTIENLSHSYGERILFKNVNFNIETGDKIGLIGINGTGKSTLLRHIAEMDGGRDPETGGPGRCAGPSLGPSHFGRTNQSHG